MLAVELLKEEIKMELVELDHQDSNATCSLKIAGRRGLVDRALDSEARGRGFNSRSRSSSFLRWWLKRAVTVKKLRYYRSQQVARKILATQFTWM